MKILLISDIHGNYPALEAVARAATPLACDHVLNCGDSLVYAPFANETLDWLRRHQVFTIRGNTDDRVIKLLKGKQFKKPSKAEKRIMYTSTAAVLSPENQTFLLELKKKKLLRLGQTFIGLFHGSPDDHEEFLGADTPEKRFKELAKETNCEVVVTGHSHSPYHRYVNGVHFINPGSVGRMFDGCPDASYAILELAHGRISVRHHRCPYDVEAVAKALRDHQLPPIYEEMFRTGRKLGL
ncbi:phosphodiesterase, MJ0936 family [Desulfobulbus propionicus DSM 2032]|uniref:Phosphoesterase n=1 Tax=Desulfobulbus propionicus (strain ATCC 33891 / DSM 2032 / VKM B-1956 / 1pr3) TaxID=577650 RepID=A0A7U4DP97_DESPD|nr:YfcE family phosphodiesterase [Desulfobulbus propionicus]ADW17827.1 phosphodiesterase, MJ0936 family [Desulfobulbus propionicus DSM 2032]